MHVEFLGFGTLLATQHQRRHSQRRGSDGGALQHEEPYVGEGGAPSPRPMHSFKKKKKCQVLTDRFVGLLAKYHLHAEGLWPRASRGLNRSTADETWTRGLQLFLEGAEPGPRFHVRPGRRAPEAFRWWGDLCELASGSAVDAVPDGAVPPAWQASLLHTGRCSFDAFVAGGPLLAPASCWSVCGEGE